MAFTIELIKFQDILPVLSIPRFVPGLPKTIEILGTDFTSAVSVFINDVPAKEFMIISKTTIWAQLPDGTPAVKTISILSSNFTRAAPASKVSFLFGTKTKKIDGILKLVQLFIKELLKTQGSDIFEPDTGGGLLSIVGMITSTHRTEPVLAAISQSISVTAQQIRKSQLNIPNLPLAERLLAASIMDLRMDRNLDQAQARVQVDSVAGQTAIAALDL